MQEPYNSPPVAPRPPRRYSVVGPVILIALGLVFLAQNMGLLDWNIWGVLWRLWPVWLIAVGLDLLLGRRTEWGSWVVLGLVVALLGGAFWYGVTVQPAGYRLGESVSVSQPVDRFARAEVVIDSSVARLLVTGGGTENLVEGTVTPLDFERIQKDARGSGDTLYFTLKSRGEGFGIPMNISNQAPTWDLRLSNQIPMNLRFDTGVGESRIDLTGVQLTDLDIDAGVGATEVTLPGTGRFRVDIDSGVGKVTLRIPRTLAARISVDQGVGGVRVYGDWDRQGKDYLSPNYGQAENRVEIEIDGGVGEIVVEEF